MSSKKALLNFSKLVMIVASILFYSCKQNRHKENHTAIKPTAVPNETNAEIKGKAYSDSMVNALVKRQSRTSEKIDSFRLLHEINCNQKSSFTNHIFSEKSVDSYEPYQTDLDVQIQKILGVSKCISKHSSSEFYDAYIFLSNSSESHSQVDVSVIAIDKNSNTFRSLPLIMEYGNELGNYVISSELKPENKIERTINHNINYIHGIGEVDSVYSEKELYQLNDKGAFKLLKSSIEKSTLRNSIFEN